jgi:predicted nucleic acid-binding protein
VLDLLRKYARKVAFLAPDTAFHEAREHLPRILSARLVPVAPAMLSLDLLARIVDTVQSSIYLPFEATARELIDRRDSDDWPVLASALALDCPIWTEDTDFFGCGVATWTTDRIDLYLAKASGPNL